MPRVPESRFVLILVALVVGCSDGRPSESEAAQFFRQSYPNVELVGIAISEDEVLARSFAFRYRTNRNMVREV